MKPRVRPQPTRPGVYCGWDAIGAPIGRTGRAARRMYLNGDLDCVFFLGAVPMATDQGFDEMIRAKQAEAIANPRPTRIYRRKSDQAGPAPQPAAAVE